MKYKVLVKNSAAKHDVKFVEYEVPELKDHECLIRVKAVGICGSDLHMYDGHGGYDWVTYPLVLGHEVTGEVIAVGNNNATEYLSKRVVIDPYKSCGQCGFCLRGETNRCDFNEYKTIKTPIEALRYGFREAGGMAQLMVVDIKNIIPIDENVSDSVAAISEALAVSYTAVKKVEHFHSKRVLVVGPGPIGLGVGAVLIGSGNEQVDMLGTTVDENRLKLAKSIGIKMTYMSEEEILTKDFNGYDAIIDCSGHPSVPQMAMRLLKRGGQLVLVGINSASFSIPMDQIVRGEISINGSYGITRGNYEEVLKLAAIPTYPFDKLIAEKVPFSQCTKGFEKALNKVSGKVVITM